jgi:hypothetical protein
MQWRWPRSRPKEKQALALLKIDSSIAQRIRDRARESSKRYVLSDDERLNVAEYALLLVLADLFANNGYADSRIRPRLSYA